MEEAYNFSSVKYSTAVGTDDGEIPDEANFLVDRGVVMIDDGKFVVCKQDDVDDVIEPGYSRKIWKREILFCNIHRIRFENIVGRGGNHRMGRVTIDTEERGQERKFVLQTTRKEMKRFKKTSHAVFIRFHPISP